MKVTVKKLYKGHADVRDYIAQKCVQKNESLKIQYCGKTMTIPVDEIVDRKRWVTQVEGKFTGEPYNLWSYKFIPDEQLVTV